MLELRNISVEIGDGEEVKKLLNDVSAHWPHGCFCAIIGPSGCGKSTLVKSIAGLIETASGGIHWRGRNLEMEGDFAVGELAYVPQFSIAHESLTVDESMRFASRLRVAGISDLERDAHIERVLTEVSLLSFADRQVKVLSGGQRRRLALALELLSNPALLLCDEVTSGLDPRSEDEIVRLLAELAHNPEHPRIVLSVTHSLKQIECYDAVTVLYQGRLAFHGAASHFNEFFSIADQEQVYDRLAEQPPEAWAEQWLSLQAGAAATNETKTETTHTA